MNRPTALCALSVLLASLGLPACDVRGESPAPVAAPSAAAPAAPAASAPVRSIYSIVPD